MATAKAATKSKSGPQPRQLKKPRFGRRLKKHLKVERRPLPSSWRLLRSSIRHLFKHWRVFIGITLVYLVLTFVLVQGFGVSNNIGQLKSILLQTYQGKTAYIDTSVTLFGVLLKSIGSVPNDVAGAYQTILLVMVSLAIIWALRQTHNDKAPKITMRDAFYKGLAPLVPLLLVLLVMGLQLLPLAGAAGIYNLVFANHIATHWYEQYAWGLLVIGMVVWSVYMVSSSIFALYIVTLPDVRPFQALRSAKDLVRYRRLQMMLKVVFLPVALLVITALIIVPLIFVWVSAVQWVFLILTMFALAVTHSYMYSLYRSLL